ncbi:HupE/UreJ family protein [Hahella aquimaris]|uniref:HupE/UreJ family protein n=1 Tax=Hahella sp. HNIBRBA332 TaxID=3015983 RepID=UPI00273CEDBD|nr:HupE/UreJ family protein [Hahella sp. HNIBRBA332]WLQ13432.1 HupE/UreJ family protein [Hahella sp. HNIBRBA332]
MLRKIIISISLWTLSMMASAHLSGFTDTSIQIAEPGVKVIYTLPSDNLLELEPNVEMRVAPPEDYITQVAAGWFVAAGKRACFLEDRKAKALPEIASYQYTLTYQCPQGMEAVSIRYELFNEQWRGHQNYVRVFMADNRMRMRFTFDRQKLDLPVAKLLQEWGSRLSPEFLAMDPHRRLDVEGWENPLADDQGAQDEASAAQSGVIDPAFLWVGMEHIWQGADHILFLLCLLLVPASFGRILLWATSFTLAHSITLALSAFEVISIPPSVTEPLIALTIVFLGLENLYYLARQNRAGVDWDKVYRNRWWVIFCFGLIHGVGFSYLLRELSSGEGVWGRLLMFNLGVEIGQVAIIALLLIPAYVMFKWRHGLKLGGVSSLLTSLVGLIWLAQRI